jgi:hypothetical protein
MLMANMELVKKVKVTRVDKLSSRCLAVAAQM